MTLLLEWALPGSLVFSILIAWWGMALIKKRIPHGSMLGPRMPETLADAESWNAAARVLGAGFLLVSVALAVAILFSARSLWGVLGGGVVVLLAPPIAMNRARRAALRVYRARHGDVRPVAVGGGRYLPGKRT